MTPSGTLKLTLLIVDDSRLVRAGLRRLLSSVSGVRIVGEAGSVPEAIQRFEDLKPDAVILDIQMPGGSGIDVLKWIKSRAPSCLVIMASSCPAHVYGPLCRKQGADHYFDKAGEMNKLVDVLDSVLGATTSASKASPAAIPSRVVQGPLKGCSARRT